MTDNFNAYAKRLMRKLEVLRLDAKHRKQEQLVHDLGECLTLLSKMEKNIDSNIFDITDRSQ
jgi:hypothetical protein